MYLFRNVRKVHYNYVVEELQLRNATFERTKLNAKGKEVKTAIKQLTSIPKRVMHPNEIEESCTNSCVVDVKSDS